MGTRFRKSIKLGKGLNFNINKNSIGISAGVKGARISVNSKGRVTKTVGIPGTGLYHTTTSSINKSNKVNKINRIYYDNFNNTDDYNIQNSKKKKNNFTIRFLDKYDTLFYADNYKIEIVNNYGKYNQKVKKWNFDEIERAEIQGDCLLFGSENACFDAVHFYDKNLQQAERFVNIIENYEEPTIEIDKILIEKQVQLYENNIDLNFMNSYLNESMIVDNKITLNVKLKKDVIGVNIILDNQIIGKFYPKNACNITDVIHSFLVIENFNRINNVDIHGKQFKLLVKEDLNLKLINYELFNKEEINLQNEDLKKSKEKAKKTNRVPYIIPKIEKPKINYSKFIIPAIIILIIIGIWGSGSFTVPPEKITLEEFNKIESGMTYDEVVQIVGSQGELVSQADIDLKGLEDIGIKDGDLKTEMYMWYGADDISNANVMLQGGKVISKAQIGLK